MKSFVAAVALAGAAQALVVRDGSCCFHLTGSGSVSGPIGQLSDGQNRVGQSGLPEGDYCIGANGGLTDGNGRGCILTPPTTQFQCDTGASPTTGFSVSCDGTLLYNGSPKFYACKTGDNGENIYTTTSSDQTGCSEITLTADSCKSGCTTSSATPSPTATTSKATSAAPAPTASSSSCPAALSGNYEYPHLIVPVSSASPDKEYGTSYNGTVTPNDISSIFNFDIPSSDSGKTCSLVFLFPKQSDLETSSFSFSGNGAIDFASLSGVASQSTDYANKPAVSKDLGTFTVAPGNSYTIATFSCPSGQAVAYELSSSSTSLNYFQDYNPSPIGLYITTC